VQAPLILITAFGRLASFQHLRKVGPGLRRRGRDARLHDAQMVDDESRVGMAIDERSADFQIVPAQDVDRKSWRTAARAIRSRPGSSGSRLALRRQHDADSDRARRLLPVGNDIGNRRIVWVDRLTMASRPGWARLHLHGIAGVVAVHGKGGDEDRAVDADFVHRRHHLVTRDVIGPVRHTVPRSLRRVAS